MLRFVVRRLLLLAPILVGLSILIFAWIHALPGGPAQSLLGERATPALVQAYREKYGLNRSIPEQYWSYLKTVWDGDFGTRTETSVKSFQSSKGLTPDGIVREMNQRWVELTGLSHAELTGRQIREFAPALKADDSGRLLQQLIAGKTTSTAAVEIAGDPFPRDSTPVVEVLAR